MAENDGQADGVKISLSFSSGKSVVVRIMMTDYFRLWIGITLLRYSSNADSICAYSSVFATGCLSFSRRSMQAAIAARTCRTR